MLENYIDKHFGFLERDFGFKKMPEYNYVKEIHNDYMKGNIIIKFIYEGSYGIYIMKSKVALEDLINGNKRTVDYSLSYFENHYLNPFSGTWKTSQLADKEYNSEKYLLCCAELLKNNPDILNGHTFKFSFAYMVLKKLGIMK